jgi:hypothetical protein
MDDESPSRAQPALRTGGTVEPLNRATVAKSWFQVPDDAPVERYELRDPFAETTYRSNSFAEMTSKAEQLGSTRFSAVDADGKRSPVVRVLGQWEREVPHQAMQPAQDASRPADRAAPDMHPASHGKGSAKAQARSTVRIDAQAERAALQERLQAALQERYVIKRPTRAAGDLQMGQTEYRFRGDMSRIAFTETTFRLATDTNSPSVARSMVDVAEARNWKALRVAGNEDFRRLVWLEASIRGVKIVGYEPVPADLEQLKAARDARLFNRVERVLDDGAGTTAADKASGRGGGRKAVIAAIDAILVSKGVSPARREAVLAAATEQLASRTRAGQSHMVKLLDKAAPTQKASAVRPTPSRSRERAAPTR